MEGACVGLVDVGLVEAPQITKQRCWPANVLDFAMSTSTDLPKALINNRGKSLGIVQTLAGTYTLAMVALKAAQCLKGGYRMSPIGAFEANVAKNPGKIAVMFEQREITWDELSKRVNQWTRWAIQQGLKKGDVVSLDLENCPEYMCFCLGLGRIGVVTACINTNLTGDSLSHCIKIAESKLIVVGVHQAKAYAELSSSQKPLADDKVFVLLEDYKDTPDANHGTAYPEIDDDVASLDDSPIPRSERVSISQNDPYLYIYTSGTTGLPKASLIRNSRFASGAVLFGYMEGVTAEDVFYMVLPMYHSSGGIVGAGNMIYQGCTLALRRRFSASKFFKECAEYGATCIQYLGEFCRYLLAQPERPTDQRHKIKVAFGNGMSPDVWNAFKRRFNIPKIGEWYAATEGAGTVINLHDECGFSGAVGWVPWYLLNTYPARLVKFDFDNEELVRDAYGRCIPCGPEEPGHLLTEIRDFGGGVSNYDGYVGNESATNKKIATNVFKDGDKWFITGDIFVYDSNGFFYFMDRVGDTFRWKGENVSTTEVAHAFSKLSWVYECNVYGVLVPNHDGRAGMAAVSVKGGESFDPVDFYHAGETLPIYARPAFVRLISKMDTTGTFKHRKVDMQKDGFDPVKCNGDVYVRDDSAKTYIKIGEKEMAELVVGNMRL
eukprot:Clim_evm4s224 gene=Clim_evmTU4s224